MGRFRLVLQELEWEGVKGCYLTINLNTGFTKLPAETTYVAVLRTFLRLSLFLSLDKLVVVNLIVKKKKQQQQQKTKQNESFHLQM